MLEQVFLGGLILCMTAMLVVRGWQSSVVLLLLAYACGAGLVMEQPFALARTTGGLQLNLLGIVILVTGVVCGTMLLVTGRVQPELPNETALDERSRMEQRQLVRRVPTALAESATTRWLLPGGAIILMLSATLLLPRFYADAGRMPLHYAWTTLVVGGLLCMLVARNLLTLGCGLVAVMLGLQLLYIAVDPDIALLVIVLLNLATSGLALTIAYLGGLVRSRLRTYELSRLYQLHDVQPARPDLGVPGKL